MDKRDYDAFAQVLDVTYDLISGGKTVLSGEAKAVFFADLARYPLGMVKAGFSAHRKDPQHGRYVPKPADIIHQIELHAPSDSRPGPEEAWAMVPKGEDESGVCTQEMLQAFVAAKPLMDGGKNIAARLAFIEAYKRLVVLARDQNPVPEWFPSLGSNKGEQASAIQKAVDAGRMSAEHAQRLLPNTNISHAGAKLLEGVQIRRIAP